MRRRLAVVATLAALWLFTAAGAPTVEAQTATGRGGIWGPDGFAGAGTSEGGAGVTAGFETHGAPRVGRSNGEPIVCTYYLPGGPTRTDSRTDSDEARVPSPATIDDLRAHYDDSVAAGNPDVSVFRICMQGATVVRPRELVPWSPSDAGLMSPDALMQIARSWLDFPTPTGSTTPPLDPGTVAQLPTFFHVDNWQPVSERASAGPVWAEVTATPVRQTWSIRDSVRGTTYPVDCAGPGATFDPASGAAAPPGACSWVPPHSSAGQSDESETSGQPCFDATVSVTWHITWDSNVPGAGGDLADATESSRACLVVGEVQAVVTESR